MRYVPTLEQVARAAANYATAELRAFDSWLSYEDELARELLKDATFRCTAEYAIGRVVEIARWNKGMQQMIATMPNAQLGHARIAGNILGEWLGGHTSVDAQLSTW